MSLLLRQVQTRLKTEGFYHAEIDGDFGPLSLAALVKEKESKGIRVPIMLAAAIKELGVKERPGNEVENPRIIQYHHHTDLGATHDEVPWCSAFLCCMAEENGMKSPHSASAISWMNWGVGLHSPLFGCVAVFQRTGGNHVALYLDDLYNEIMILGGNQHDQVCVSVGSKSLLRGYRWAS